MSEKPGTIAKNPFKFGKIVEGDDFCNRKNELKQLKNYILDGYSVWLYSSRRFGKTSLLLKAFGETKKVKCLVLDLYNIQSTDDFCRKYARVLAQNLFNWKDDIKTITARFSQYFKNLYPVVSFDETGSPSLSLQAASIEKQHDIETLLNIPEEIARKRKIKICIAFDEFQEIKRINQFMVHWMRAAFQRHQNVSYIFMGSKPSLMKDIFASANSPFYEFGIKMEIKPISNPDFSGFLKSKFQQQGISIHDKNIDDILKTSGGHPHFTQYFASVIFDLLRDGEDQDAANFRDIWIERVLGSQSIIFQSLFDQLNLNQRRALSAIAISGGVDIFSLETRQKFKLPTSSTLTTTLNGLIKKDMINKEDNRYKIINPVFELWIKNML